jgi:hypothetical protein
VYGAICLALGIASAGAQERDEREASAQDTAREESVPHPHREMRDRYLWATFGPPGLIGAGILSGFQQWRDVPSEWRQTPAGYGNRFAGAFAQTAVDNTTKYLVARAFDEDPSFRPCECVGTMRRLRHAVLGPFRARKFASGQTVFSFARVAGIAAGNVAATTWYPPQKAEEVAAHVAIDIAAKISVDVLREFVLHRRSLKPGGGLVPRLTPRTSDETATR